MLGTVRLYYLLNTRANPDRRREAPRFTPAGWHRQPPGDPRAKAPTDVRMPTLVSPRQVQLDADRHLNYFFG